MRRYLITLPDALNFQEANGRHRTNGAVGGRLQNGGYPSWLCWRGYGLDGDAQGDQSRKTTSIATRGLVNQVPLRYRQWVSAGCWVGVRAFE